MLKRVTTKELTDWWLVYGKDANQGIVEAARLLTRLVNERDLVEIDMAKEAIERFQGNTKTTLTLMQWLLAKSQGLLIDESGDTTVVRGFE